MSDTLENIPETAFAWHEQNGGAALATVIETWGSAPRPAGAQLAISKDGAIAGSVSGGCVEGAVVVEAQEAMENGTSRVLEFGVSDDEAFAVGLACGGNIRVMVEPIGSGIELTLLKALLDARARRQPIAYVVDTDSWTRRLADPDEFPDRFTSDKSGIAEDGRTFIGIHNPPLRLAIVGASHIAQPLAGMAKMAGYDVTIIDPREAFASPARFPGFSINNDWPDAALATLGLDGRTAVVTLAHDPKIDDPAILAALASDVIYIGCLGSKRTHAKRLERLVAAGVPPERLKRIHGPVGMRIGAKSPAEIAISVLSELTMVLRQR